MKHLKDAVKKIKEENGNLGYTQKEMLMYLVDKGDKRDCEISKINKKLGKGAGKIAANREAITMIKWVFGCVGMILGLAITISAAIK